VQALNQRHAFGDAFWPSFWLPRRRRPASSTTRAGWPIKRRSRRPPPPKMPPTSARCNASPELRDLRAGWRRRRRGPGGQATAAGPGLQETADRRVAEGRNQAGWFSTVWRFSQGPNRSSAGPSPAAASRSSAGAASSTRRASWI